MLNDNLSAVIPSMEKPLYITVDEFGHGVGAVLFHAYKENGRMRVFILTQDSYPQVDNLNRLCIKNKLQ